MASSSWEINLTKSHGNLVYQGRDVRVVIPIVSFVVSVSILVIVGPLAAVELALMDNTACHWCGAAGGNEFMLTVIVERIVGENILGFTSDC